MLPSLSLTGWLLASISGWFGSNTAVIWNGLMWIWKGWSIRVALMVVLVVLMIFHSSTVFSGSTFHGWLWSNLTPLIVCSLGPVTLAVLKVNTRGVLLTTSL